MSLITLDMLDPHAASARARFNSFPFDPAFLAYASNDPSTKLITDSHDNPRFTAMLPQRTAVGFITGDPNGFTIDHCNDLLSTIHCPLLILSVPNPQWLEELTSSSSYKSWRVPRIDYKLVTPPSFQSPDVQILPLDDNLLARVRPEADPEFDPAGFRVLNGFGHVAIVNNRIASVAWAPAIAGWAEIAVATAPSHRQKGLARAVGLATLREALNRSLRPHVSTNRQNFPARRWAQSLGFADEILHDWVVLQKAPTSEK